MDLLAELRARLDVPADLVSDEKLNHLLDASEGVVDGWLIPDARLLYPANVDEGVVQYAIKLYDTGVRGVAAYTGEGEWVAPSPSASPGLPRSVFGALGPALATGGVSV